MRVPFVVFADFESFIKPIDTCQPNPKGSYTNKYQKHTPSSFYYYVKCFDNPVYSQEPVAYTAESEDNDVVQIFADLLSKILSRSVPLSFWIRLSLIYQKIEGREWRKDKLYTYQRRKICIF